MTDGQREEGFWWVRGGGAAHGHWEVALVTDGGERVNYVNGGRTVARSVREWGDYLGKSPEDTRRRLGGALELTQRIRELEERLAAFGERGTEYVRVPKATYDALLVEGEQARARSPEQHAEAPPMDLSHGGADNGGVCASRGREFHGGQRVYCRSYVTEYHKGGAIKAVQPARFHGTVYSIANPGPYVSVRFAGMLWDVPVEDALPSAMLEPGPMAAIDGALRRYDEDDGNASEAGHELAEAVRRALKSAGEPTLPRNARAWARDQPKPDPMRNGAREGDQPWPRVKGETEVEGMGKLPIVEFSSPEGYSITSLAADSAGTPVIVEGVDADGNRVVEDLLVTREPTELPAHHVERVIVPQPAGVNEGTIVVDQVQVAGPQHERSVKPTEAE